MIDGAPRRPQPAADLRDHARRSRQGALGPLRISAIMLALVITVTQGVVIRSILRDLGKAMITEDLVPRHHPARLT
jgi:hypothetical protein